MPKLRLDFWRKSFYQETAFGRTLSGRNKTGQAMGVVKDVALSVVPFIGKPILQATGKIVDELEANQIGRDVEELNLPDWAVYLIRIIAVGGLVYLVLSGTIGWEEARQIFDLIQQSGLIA